VSKLICVYHRWRDHDTLTAERLTAICDGLVPDNVEPVPAHRIRIAGKLGYGVAMPSSLVCESGRSLLLGLVFEERDARWDEPRSGFPDGSFVIVRNDDRYLEVVSDAAATRTVWYAYDQDVFVASTSQRAVISYLGGFEFDERIIPWMLSTGSTGPEHGYDRRLRRLPADSSIILDKISWSISLRSDPIAVAPERDSEARHRARLQEALSATIGRLDALDRQDLVLPLSGGYDSRAILCFMSPERRRQPHFGAVTWGTPDALEEPGNDAQVALALADRLGVRHEFHVIDASREPVEAVIDRFIACGEGSVDHLAGYMDGMETWRRLHAAGIGGILRGDEGFGGEQVSSEFTVRRHIGFATCSDIHNLRGVPEAFGFPEQIVPEALLRRSNESLCAWRDRLFQAYRLPTAYAALSDIKASYVDVINPLLSKSILTAARRVPDRLRTEKTLFKRIVRDVSPNVPFASKRAIDFGDDVLRRQDVVGLMRELLSSDYADALLGAPFGRFILGRLDSPATQRSRRRTSRAQRLKSIVPRALRNWLRDAAVGQTVDGNVLAFRAYLIVRMHQMLSTHLYPRLPLAARDRVALARGRPSPASEGDDAGPVEQSATSAEPSAG
jgi:asparagine synthetase B (glutamine-hydrolysing)